MSSKRLTKGNKTVRYEIIMENSQSDAQEL